MDQPIAHAGDATPRNVRFVRLRLGLKVADCFTDDLQVADDGMLNQAILESLLNVAGGVLLNLCYSVEDVPKPYGVTGHLKAAALRPIPCRGCTD